MREIERKIIYSGAFRRDFKRLENASTSLEEFDKIINLLIWDKRLPIKARDHALSGNWSDYRECHVEYDLLLIYKKPNQDEIKLFRIGSHSSVFG